MRIHTLFTKTKTMVLPDWIKNKTWQWIIGTIIAIAAIVATIVLSKSTNTPVGTNQTSTTNGDNNITSQVINSPNATIINNKIDPETLANKLANLLSNQKDSAVKDEEIKVLKATIKRMQGEPADELKQTALQALKEGDTEKAVELMEESAKSRTLSAQTHTERAEKLTKEATQDWIDIGNIAYLNDPQKALDAYEKASELAPSNHVAWNRLGLIQWRLGLLDEAVLSHEKVLELAGGNKTLQAATYSNLGIIYDLRGDLDKAEDLYLESLDISREFGGLQLMAGLYSNLGGIYQTRGELNKAEDLYLESLDISRELGGLQLMAVLYGTSAPYMKLAAILTKRKSSILKLLIFTKNSAYRRP